MDQEVDYAAKYDRFAEKFIELNYANPEIYFNHRINVIKKWGPALKSGDKILHLGCGDGYLTRLMLDEGYIVHACDLSKGMLNKVTERCSDYLNKGSLSIQLVDINDIGTLPTDTVDHVVAIMRGFFFYATDPLTTLRFIRKIVRNKVIVDFDPRKTSAKKVKEIMREAGFRNVKVRAFLVPLRVRLPLTLQKGLFLIEELPFLYRPLIWRKFHLWALGEK